jgi:ribose transport system substrate-binding protein
MKGKVFKVGSFCLLLIMCLSILLAGCGGDSAQESTAPETSGAASTAPESSDGGTAEVGAKRIVMLIKNNVNPFFVDMANAATAQCEEYGWEIEVLSPIKSDNNEEQIELLRQALLDPPDAFVIVPADSEGITPAIEEINEANIPIVNVNTQFYDEDVDYITFVAVKNYDLAYQSATAISEVIGEGGNVLLIEGITGAQTSIDRTKGATAAFEDAGVNILATQTADYSRQKAVEVTQNLLQKYADVDAIWAASGEMALGCAVAVEQANRQDAIKIACINSYEEVIQAVVDGKIYLTADDVADLQGSTGVSVLMDYFEGKEVPKETILESKIIDDSNIDVYKEKYGIE